MNIRTLPFAATAALLCAAPLWSAANPVLVAAPQDAVDTNLARGRALLDEGRAEEALAAFEQAVAAAPSAARTRVWVVRAQAALGRFDDALMGSERLATEHKGSIEADYAFGMTFWIKARTDVLNGTTTSVTGGEFADAAKRLAAVTAQEDARFADAWPALAESAWYGEDLETARPAAERGVALRAADPEAWRILGEVCMSQHNALPEDADAERESHRDRAIEAFGQAAEAYGASAVPYKEWWQAKCLSKQGEALVLAERVEDAQKAWAHAIGLNPNAVDFLRMLQFLPGENAVAALKAGHGEFVANQGTETADDALLLWWKGRAEYDQAQFDDAIQSFDAALKKNPSYVNSWYYLYRSHLAKQQREEALESLRTAASDARPLLVETLRYNPAIEASYLESLVGWAVTPSNHGGKTRNIEAAWLCELLTEVQPTVDRHWNNVGLFLRDEADRLMRSMGGTIRARSDDYDKELVGQLLERSTEAYRKALELDPENPNTLNDLGVMLHYYLVRDLDEAMELYKRSEVAAKKRLEDDSLSEQDREIIGIALRDSVNNQRFLAEFIEQREREAGKKAEGDAGGDPTDG